MRPFTPFWSPPALPMNTRPSQAIGAAGTTSFFLASPIAIRRFLEARSSYYAAFARWGIPERTIRALKEKDATGSALRCRVCLNPASNLNGRKDFTNKSLSKSLPD
jgi:hypothetical protein